MEVRRVDDPGAFLAAAGPLLLEDEARNNLLLGLAATLRDAPFLYPDYRLWLVEDAGRPVGAALRTPPHKLALARPLDDAALEALAEALDVELPGVVGGVPEADVFAQAWSAKTGQRARVLRSQGIHALERVQPVAGVPGRLRTTEPRDRALLLAWFRAFAQEALGGAPPDDHAVVRELDYRVAAPEAGVVVWDHAGAASLAGFGGRTPNGIRIGPVYTPPERRRCGYATALVAELSSRLLANRRFCFLYTDLANQTANKIYQQIGYERVCESAEIVFEPAA
jgi:predicted GNAT family acetyltransferase